MCWCGIMSDAKALTPNPSPIGEGEQWTPLDYPGGLVDGQFEHDQWEGLPQLRCILCQWDTLRGVEAARAHKQACPRCNPPPDEASESVIVVADKRGHVKAG